MRSWVFHKGGEILGQFTGAETDMLLNLPVGCEALEGQGRSLTHRVLDGVIVEKPPRPGEHFSWSSEEGIWVEDHEALLASVREERNRLLAACDWTQVPDSPLSPESRSAWAVYRQALRDFPAEGGDWPVPPS